MPREDRRIIFDFSETYNAIYSLNMKSENHKFPPGKITEINYHPDDEKRVIIKLDNPQDDKTTEEELTQDFVAAALLLLCKGEGIPVPKGSKKAIEFTEDSTVLRIMV